jgi:hypothetical protein
MLLFLYFTWQLFTKNSKNIQNKNHARKTNIKRLVENSVKLQ